MRKKRFSPVAALVCAVYMLSSCSGHFVNNIPKLSQNKKDFNICMDFFGDDGSRLILFSDGTGNLSEKSLDWVRRDGAIECILLPESSVGRTMKLAVILDGGFPFLRADGVSFYIKKKPREASGESIEEIEENAEPALEELVAREGQEVANLCFGFIGWDYVYGGKSPDTGFDCSGLVYYVYDRLGYRLERVANAQAKQGILIEKDDAKPGDILCFGAPDYCSHVGIYVGQRCYIHAMGSGYGVVLNSLDDPYLKRPKYEVRRIVGCDWLKTENIEAALAAGLPTPTPPAPPEM